MNVITRFAPSPTGMLHIGGARTALFNYLFARAHGGQFLLRIEDTDAARSTPEAKQAILDGMAWLGLKHDGEIVYQMSRSQRHREVAEALVGLGHAYYCYCTPEELSTMRAAAEAKGEAFRYDRRWRDGGTPPAGVLPSIRIKAPLSGEVLVHDNVQGNVRFGTESLDDFVILRSDGTPTYMLAVVVDDHDMGITHIIRGDDHLNNAGRQSILYQAMGWNIPQFAHIPLIHGPDGAKLSKRHGATSVMEYAAMGYLPEAMRNYLLRLGWSHGDDELISDAQALEWFNLEHIGQSPSRLDFDKLKHVNAHYIRARSDEDLAALLNSLPPCGGGLGWGDSAFLSRAIASVKERASTLPELAEAVQFYLHAPQSYDEKAHAALSKNGSNIALVIPALEALPEPWSADSVKAALMNTAETHGKKIGEIMPPLRAAIVGAMSGPDVPLAIAILGKAETLARLNAPQRT
jgi:glutamyl-tRNA synthetase